MTTKDTIKTCAGIPVLGMIQLFIIRLAYGQGVKDGRTEFQHDLISTLDAKGGAPVLIYPDENWTPEIYENFKNNH